MVSYSIGFVAGKEAKEVGGGGWAYIKTRRAVIERRKECISAGCQDCRSRVVVGQVGLARKYS